ncbi:MAG: winged helix-turn-helix domain-containing protein [Candidatus Thorarchaeota archaeon]
MYTKIQDEELQKIILSSYQRISELFKAVAHEIRIQIMALLLNKSESFSFLIEHIKTCGNKKLSKTALAHHLNQLVEENLIAKESRGMYELTEKSRTFLKAVIAVSQGLEISIIGTSNLPDYLKRVRTSTRNHISCNPVYQGGWNSYIAAVSGVLESLGVIYDHYYLSGRTGYCFIFRISKGMFGYIGEGILNNKTWQEIYKGTNSFGWEVNDWSLQTVINDTNPLDTDPEPAKEMFEQIKIIIDKYDSPVVVWGIPMPNFGIVKGYDENNYIVSSYLRKEGRKEVPIPYDSISAKISWIGGVYRFLYFTKNDEEILIDEVEREAILRALNMARGMDLFLDTRVHGFSYVFGLEAYDEWTNILLNNDTISKVSNGFYGRYYHDAKSVAMLYLERLGRKYSELQLAQGELLLETSKQYHLIKNLFEEYLIEFPYYRELIGKKKVHKTEFKYFEKLEKLTTHEREIGSEILFKAKKLEENAHSLLKSAYKDWEFS